MLSLPDIEYGYALVPNPANFVTICEDKALPTRIMMQKLATQVLSTVASCGSAIKVFCSKSSIIPGRMKMHLSDSDGHHWTEYNYLRGELTDLMAKEVVVAVPPRNVDLEMPSDLMLHQTVKIEDEDSVSW
jgi:hypothetical protein